MKFSLLLACLIIVNATGAYALGYPLGSFTEHVEVDWHDFSESVHYPFGEKIDLSETTDNNLADKTFYPFGFAENGQNKKTGKTVYPLGLNINESLL
jgi:hypothetical protein